MMILQMVMILHNGINDSNVDETYNYDNNENNDSNHLNDNNDDDIC